MKQIERRPGLAANVNVDDRGNILRYAGAHAGCVRKLGRVGRGGCEAKDSICQHHFRAVGNDSEV